MYQTIQKEVDVPVLDAGKCQAALASTRLGNAFVFDANSFICAGGEPGKDSCTVRELHSQRIYIYMLNALSYVY